MSQKFFCKDSKKGECDFLWVKKRKVSKTIEVTNTVWKVINSVCIFAPTVLATLLVRSAYQGESYILRLI
jgi:hypothetical protein